MTLPFGSFAEHSDREHALVAGIRAGDAGAFKALFHEYWRPLCVYADRVVNAKDVAEDIVQAVFARIWEQRETFSISGSLRAYLFTAVRNGVINHLKRETLDQKLSMSIEPELFAVGTTPLDPELRLEHEEKVAALRGALRTLPPRMRLVATMRWYERLSHAEIAHALGISTATVNNHLTGAIKALRRQLA